MTSYMANINRFATKTYKRPIRTVDPKVEGASCFAAAPIDPVLQPHAMFGSLTRLAGLDRVVSSTTVSSMSVLRTPEALLLPSMFCDMITGL